MAAGPVSALAVAIQVEHSDALEPWLTNELKPLSFRRTGSPQPKTEHVLVARENGSEAIVGAAQGHSQFGGAYVSMIAVRKDWRASRGVGKSLLARLFELGQHAAPPAAVGYLATFDFQGLTYYPKVGFKQDCALPGWAHGISAAWFSKNLPLDGPAAVAAAKPFRVEVVADPASADAVEVSAFLAETVAEHEAETIGREDGFFAFGLQALLAPAPAPAGEERAGPTADAAARGEEPLPGVTAAVGDGAGPGIRVGAISCFSFWGGLVISQLAVAEPHRRRGVGTSLVQAALQAARDDGCVLAVVDVMTFPEPAGTCDTSDLLFWEKLGFRQFGCVTGFSTGAQLVRLQQRLDHTAASPAAADAVA